MLNQQFNNDLHPQFTGLLDKGNDIRQLSKARIDLQMIADIVTLIQKRRQVEGRYPDHRRAHSANIAQLRRHSGDIAAAIAVEIVKQG